MHKIHALHMKQNSLHRYGVRNKSLHCNSKNKGKTFSVLKHCNIPLPFLLDLGGFQLVDKFHIPSRCHESDFRKSLA